MASVRRSSRARTGRGRTAAMAPLLFVALLFGGAVQAGEQDGVAPAGAAQEEQAGEHAAEEQAAEHAAEEQAADEGHGTATDEHAADEHAAEEHAGPSWRDYLYKWINFGLLVALLYWLLVVPPGFVKENFEFEGLKVVLAQRAAAIVAARDLAKEQQEDATTRADASAARLEKVDNEVAALLEDARAAAVTERQRLEGAAVEEADRIRVGASRDMKAEVRRARADLQGHVADLAVAVATGIVKKNFTGDDQARLVREYLERLGHTVG